jgi:hypothetical protein
MIYYEKRGKWPFLRAKKQDSEGDYVPKLSDLRVMADSSTENGISESVFEPAAQ